MCWKPIFLGLYLHQANEYRRPQKMMINVKYEILSIFKFSFEKDENLGGGGKRNIKRISLVPVWKKQLIFLPVEIFLFPRNWGINHMLLTKEQPLPSLFLEKIFLSSCHQVCS